MFFDVDETFAGIKMRFEWVIIPSDIKQASYDLSAASVVRWHWLQAG